MCHSGSPSSLETPSFLSAVSRSGTSRTSCSGASSIAAGTSPRWKSPICSSRICAGSLSRWPGRRISWTADVDEPLDPARIVNRLEATALGCRWLLDRWGELRRILDAGLKWTSPDRLRAVRLLGKQPLDAADDELPDAGLVVVEDAETGEQLVVDSGDPLLRARLRAAWWH